MNCINDVRIKKVLNNTDTFTVAIGEYTLNDENMQEVFVGNYLATVGEKFHFKGIWNEHKTYGKQFRVKDSKKITKLSSDDIIEYLIGFEGIGRQRAQLIVAAFKEDSLKVIKENCQEIIKIGIPEEIAINLSETINKNIVINDLVTELKPFGFSMKVIERIYDKYKSNSMMVIKENPYRMIDEVNGISFNLADGIARRHNIPINSPSRIKAGIREALNIGMEKGHTFLFVKELLLLVYKILFYGKETERPSILKVLASMDEYKEVIIESDTACYLPSLYYAERYCGRKISKIKETKSKVELTRSPEKIIEEIESEVGFKYAEQQKEAIKKALTEKIVILTGGPGTGKTTTVNGIIKAIIKNNPQTNLELCAPTGKAAKRMEEATSIPAKTIHRQLEYKPCGNGDLNCGKNEFNNINADVIIVDEFSMTDVLLLEKLFKAINIGTRLIIVGDVDQLPSVGAGNVLFDMIKSEVITTIRLNVTFRQAETSMIVVNAKNINEGKFPDFSKEDFTLDEIEGDDLIAQTIVDQYIKLLNEGNTVDEVQVLTPLKVKTSCGSRHLNKLLQNAVNPLKSDISEVSFGNLTYRKGDKVMQTKNNYEKDCFNGDTGKIIDINTNSDDAIVRVEFAENKIIDFIGREEILELELAYAITVHKSQGSEYKIVLMPVVTSHSKMLVRKLLYTGITRAKKIVKLYGSKKAVQLAVENKTVQKRNSKLYLKLF